MSQPPLSDETIAEAVEDFIEGPRMPVDEAFWVSFGSQFEELKTGDADPGDVLASEAALTVLARGFLRHSTPEADLDVPLQPPEDRSEALSQLPDTEWQDRVVAAVGVGIRAFNEAFKDFLRHEFEGYEGREEEFAVLSEKTQDRVHNALIASGTSLLLNNIPGLREDEEPVPPGP